VTSLFFRLRDAHFYGFARFRSKVFYILHAVVLSRARMKNPGLTRKLIRFLSATSLAAAVTVVAQPDRHSQEPCFPREAASDLSFAAGFELRRDVAFAGEKSEQRAADRQLDADIGASGPRECECRRGPTTSRHSAAAGAPCSTARAIESVARPAPFLGQIVGPWQRTRKPFAQKVNGTGGDCGVRVQSQELVLRKREHCVA